MTTRNLFALFQPRAIALIGASRQEGSVGAVIARNLLNGGFRGRVMLVNPHETEIFGAECSQTIDALPEVPDLAVVATPAATVPQIVRELGDAGGRAAIVVSAGIDPIARQRILAAAKPYLLRILGPNCVGFLSPAMGINASFAQAQARTGGLALLSQSGAIATTLLDWANSKGVGFSHILSLGDMADIDFGDLLDYLAADAATRAILIYAENITHARKFMSAARIAARAKPVIMVKGGRSASGAKAAASHTGALAGSDLVYDAALRRAGILRVDTLDELFAAAETLSAGTPLNGDRLTIITNGGGLGVMAADELEARGGKLEALSDATLASLDKALPPAWSHANPIDILGDAPPERYDAAIAALAADVPNNDVLVINCPVGVADGLAAAKAVAKAHALHPNLPLLCCWAGEETAMHGRHHLEAAGLAVYETPEAAVRAFQQRVNHAHNQALLMEAPATGSAIANPERISIAQSVIGVALAEQRAILTAPESRKILAAYGVPVAEQHIAATPARAGEASLALPGPVALKILSRDITHKTDLGGVMLGLQGAAAVEKAAFEMLATVRQRAPNARIDGFTVERMIERTSAQELIVGVAADPTFGPCILFGHGGIATEVIADRAIGLPPLNDVLAHDLIGRTRISRLLAGYRDRTPVDRAVIAQVLVAVSDLVAEIPEIAELDINPLLADSAGATALDARIVVRNPPQVDPDRLAIRPYPCELARTIEIADQAYRIRPIQPADAGRLVDMAKLTSASDLRLRFHGGIHTLSDAWAARLAQIDYDREMVLVAEESGGTIAGVVRMAFDPQFETSELAIIVRSDAQDHGLGRQLLIDALAYGKARGASLIWGDVMRENGRMLDLATRLGASRTTSPNGPMLVRVEFRQQVETASPSAT